MLHCIHTFIVVEMNNTSLHSIVRNQDKVSQAYEMFVSKKDYIPNEQRFILLLEMNKVSLC